MHPKNNEVLSEELSFVVQGPIIDRIGKNKKCTCVLLKSIRLYFPKAQIVLSTWESEKTNGLDYDILVKNKPPTAVKTYYDGQLKLFPVNHQIVSTFEGLKRCDRKYAIKVRSDMRFENNRILNYLIRYNSIGSEYHEWRFFSQRVIVLPTYNYRRGVSFPFDIADWIYCGLKKDLLDLFDIPLLDVETLKMREKNGEMCAYAEDNIGTEQYICVAFIKKHIPKFDFWGWESFDEKYQLQSEIFYGQNFIFLPASKWSITSQKGGRSGYCAKPILSSGLYTFCEWKRLYNNYGGGNERFINNYLEEFVYKVIFGMRVWTKKHCKTLYQIAINFVRKIR